MVNVNMHLYIFSVSNKFKWNGVLGIERPLDKLFNCKKIAQHSSFLSYVFSLGARGVL